MYHRRTKLNPLLASVVVAGIENGEPYVDLFFIRSSLVYSRSVNRFLGRVNDKGSAYKEFLIMTGIANHLAQGWIRTILENSNSLNKEQAEQLMDRVIKQLYYRDCRGFARVSVVNISIDHCS
jgi:20S proteasome subunit beta 7